MSLRPRFQWFGVPFDSRLLRIDFGYVLGRVPWDVHRSCFSSSGGRVTIAHKASARRKTSPLSAVRLIRSAVGARDLLSPLLLCAEWRATPHAAPVTRYLDRLRRGLLFRFTLTRLWVRPFTEPFVSRSIDATAFWAVVQFTAPDSVGCLPLGNGVIDSSTITLRQLSSRSVCCIGNQCPFKHICPALTSHCTS